MIPDRILAVDTEVRIANSDKRGHISGHVLLRGSEDDMYLGYAVHLRHGDGFYDPTKSIFIGTMLVAWDQVEAIK